MEERLIGRRRSAKDEGRAERYSRRGRFHARAGIRTIRRIRAIRVIGGIRGIRISNVRFKSRGVCGRHDTFSCFWSFSRGFVIAFHVTSRRGKWRAWYGTLDESLRGKWLREAAHLATPSSGHDGGGKRANMAKWLAGHLARGDRWKKCSSLTAPARRERAARCAAGLGRG